MREKFGREWERKKNEHYVDTLSTNKLSIENLNGKKKDVSPTSSKVHIIPKENVALQMKRPTKDNGKISIISRCVFWL